MRHARAALLAAAALLAGCGRPLFAAEVSVPSVRITSTLQTIDPGFATTATCAGASCLLADMLYDIGGEVPFVKERGVTVDLRLTDFALHLTPAVPGGLSGLQFVRVVVLDAGGAPTLVASYVKPPDPAPMPAEILVSGDSTIDLSPFLDEGKIDARLEFGYLLASPPGVFTYQTETEFSVDVIVKYGALL